MNTKFPSLRYTAARKAFAILGATILLGFLGPESANNRADPPGCVHLRNNMVISQDTVFCPRHYVITDRAGDGVLVIDADNITVDGHGFLLDGRERRGYAIVLKGHRGVTVRGFRITGYHYGIRLEDAADLRVEENQLWENGDQPQPHYSVNRPLEEAYGGGILAHGVIDSVFLGNVGWQQNVGLDLYHSHGNTIVGNDFSANYGWGIRLYASTGNQIRGNRADYVHGCRGINCSARDTAGILLAFGSHDNVITGNSMTHGGNGLFIGNEYGLPSHNNLVEDNDCRYAVHNAIEATFSEGNIFRGNNASRSDFGFWLGFSYRTVVEGNIINDNETDGINWENGRYGLIIGNEIIGNGRHGLALVLKPLHKLIPEYPGSEASHHHTVAYNLIADNLGCGVYLSHTVESAITHNAIFGNRTDLRFDGRSERNQVSGNDTLRPETPQPGQWPKER